MKTIPESFLQAGRELSLVKRSESVAMFADNRNEWHEVHIIKVRKPCRIVKRDYPEMEILAGDEEFGKRAWTCIGRDRAESRFADAAKIAARKKTP